jgi:hypothetical protein
VPAGLAVAAGSGGSAPPAAAPVSRTPAALVAAIGLAVLVVLLIGVLPQLVLGGAVVPGR